MITSAEESFLLSVLREGNYSSAQNITVLLKEKVQYHDTKRGKKKLDSPESVFPE